MWGTVIKFVALYFVNNRMARAKHSLDEVKENAADYAETRAAFIKQNIMHDLERVVESFVGLLLMFAGLIFTGILGLMWIFTVAWNSPNREIILGVTMFIPLALSAILFVMIKNAWKQKPLMHDTTQLISEDWKSFRHGLDGTADISDEANR
ncbi:MAG TPA: phage holin family protein [Methylophilus sp.]